MSWKDGKQYLFGKIHFLKEFLCTRRMQFLRAHRNFLDKRPQNFQLISKKDGKKIEVSKTNYFHLKCRLDA